MAETILAGRILANKMLSMEGDFIFGFLERCFKILGQRTNISRQMILSSVCVWNPLGRIFWLTLRTLPGKNRVTAGESLGGWWAGRGNVVPRKVLPVFPAGMKPNSPSIK